MSWISKIFGYKYPSAQQTKPKQKKPKKEPRDCTWLNGISEGYDSMMDAIRDYDAFDYYMRH